MTGTTRGAMAAAVAVAAAVLAVHQFETPTAKVRPPRPQDSGTSIGRRTLAFEANHGQVDGEARYLARTPEGLVLFAPDELLFNPRRAGVSLRMRLEGAKATRLTAEEELPGKVNYLRGNDSTKWLVNVSTYRKLRYADAYPGIDVVYYGNQHELESDFVVHPGADPLQIRIAFENADSLEITSEGDLRILASGIELIQKKPQVYQEIDGERRAVACGYEITAADKVGLKLAAFDTGRRLIIDPVLAYSTYFGGVYSDFANQIAIDGDGNIYIAGETYSPDLPLAHPFQEYPGCDGCGHAFVTKISSDGSTLLYSTYLGGTGADAVVGLALDDEGSAYLTGYTSSLDFPVVKALQPAYGGGPYDAFVAKVAADGSGLIYSTYLGGSRHDYGWKIAVDSAHLAHVTGTTASIDFPVVSAFQPNPGDKSGMYFDVFVAEINEDGSALIYSTYLGGSNSDEGFAIAVDNDGNTYVTGDTFSSDFPLVNPFQTVRHDYQNAFLTKFSSDGSVLFSTYFGGTERYAGTSGEAIATDAEGNVYLAGSTSSFVFPLVNPFQSSPGNGFVSKFSPDGSRLIYSSYLGGGGYNESARGIAVDGAGSAYLTGYTGSPQFPVVQPIQATYGGGMYDAFISKVSPAGDQLEFSTFFGGSGDEAVWSIFNPRCCSIAVDARGSIYATGTTTSTTLPMVNPFQAEHHGWWDVFIVRLDP